MSILGRVCMKCSSSYLPSLNARESDRDDLPWVVLAGLQQGKIQSPLSSRLELPPCMQKKFLERRESGEFLKGTGLDREGLRN